MPRQCLLINPLGRRSSNILKSLSPKIPSVKGLNEQHNSVLGDFSNIGTSQQKLHKRGAPHKPLRESKKPTKLKKTFISNTTKLGESTTPQRAESGQISQTRMIVIPHQHTLGQTPVLYRKIIHIEEENTHQQWGKNASRNHNILRDKRIVSRKELPSPRFMLHLTAYLVAKTA